MEQSANWFSFFFFLIELFGPSLFFSSGLTLTLFFFFSKAKGYEMDAASLTLSRHLSSPSIHPAKWPPNPNGMGNYRMNTNSFPGKKKNEKLGLILNRWSSHWLPTRRRKRKHIIHSSRIADISTKSWLPSWVRWPQQQFKNFGAFQRPVGSSHANKFWEGHASEEAPNVQPEYPLADVLKARRNSHHRLRLLLHLHVSFTKGEVSRSVRLWVVLKFHYLTTILLCRAVLNFWTDSIWNWGIFFVLHNFPPRKKKKKKAITVDWVCTF